MKIKLRKFSPQFTKVSIAILGTSIAWATGNIVLNTVLLDQYVNKVWIRYRFGNPVKLNSKLHSLSTEVLEDLGLENKLHKINFFPISKELTYFGVYQLRKVLIGLPFYYEYQNQNQIDKDKLTFFDNQAPNWNNEDGKLYLECLVLSDKAKKYAIAEQIALATSFEKTWRCLDPLVSALFSIIFLLRVDVLFDRVYPKSNPKIKFKFGLFFSVFIYVAYYFFGQFASDSYANQKIDKFLDEIKNNQDYIEGGIEYYSKVQKKNICLRNFMGDDGKKYIKPNGDLIQWFSGRYAISEMIERVAKYDNFSMKRTI